MTQAAHKDAAHVSASPSAPVAAAAVALLDQCAALVGALPDGAYDAESSVIIGGTIGKHVRHCLDHYRAAIDGLESGDTVFYDHRARGGEVECRCPAALDEIEALRTRLSTIDESHLAEPMSVRFMITGDGVEADFATTFGREIAFAGHHAVHHFAMIKAIAAEHGVKAPSGFGTAPSTINHEAACE